MLICSEKKLGRRGFRILLYFVMLFKIAKELDTVSFIKYIYAIHLASSGYR